MKAKVNLQLLKTTSFDSGALGMLGMVVHQFPSDGRYRAVILHQGRAAADIDFDVDEKSDVMQLNIDLAQAARGAKTRPEENCDCDKQTAGMVSPKGYVLFHASSGTGYSVTVTNEDGRAAFDSTKLDKGDLFAVSLLEPAAYLVMNKIGSAKGEIAVSLTPETAKRIKTLETHYIDVGKRGFDPAHIELASSQGLVFRVKDSARILIEKGHAQSNEPSKPTIRWQSLHTAKKKTSE